MARIGRPPTKFILTSMQKLAFLDTLADFKAECEEVNPERKGNCLKVTEVKKHFAKKLMKHEEFSDENLDTSEQSRAQWEAALVKCYANYDLQKIQNSNNSKKSSSKKKNEPLKAVTTFILFDDDISPREHFISKLDPDELREKYQELRKTKGIPVCAARNQVVSELWNAADQEKEAAELEVLKTKVDCLYGPAEVSKAVRNTPKNSNGNDSNKDHGHGNSNDDDNANGEEDDGNKEDGNEADGDEDGNKEDGNEDGNNADSNNTDDNNTDDNNADGNEDDDNRKGKHVKATTGRNTTKATTKSATRPKGKSNASRNQSANSNDVSAPQCSGHERHPPKRVLEGGELDIDAKKTNSITISMAQPPFVWLNSHLRSSTSDILAQPPF
ncbi:hypothetical protein CPC08DRAFT_729502 [Agrocybe pediades]|nr:hypothetical protein CPC08DRAFT_729502 [Agrocybe pediades]